MRLEPLVPPARLAALLPIDTAATDTIVAGRQAVERVLSGDDPRLLVVIGPCSIHDPDAARDYAAKLLELSQKVADRLLVVMRVYFEKPRTTVGWKGLINDPHLDGSFDVATGLRLAVHCRHDCARGYWRPHDRVAHASANGEWTFNASGFQKFNRRITPGCR